MSDKVEIYILTSGEYSDYSINAVFTDKVVAERIAEEGGYNLEVWVADEGIENVRAGLFPYNVHGWLDEDELIVLGLLPGRNIRNDATIHHPYDQRKPRTVLEKVGSHEFMVHPKLPYFTTWLNAKDKDHALKIASERKAKLRHDYHAFGTERMEF